MAMLMPSDPPNSLSNILVELGKTQQTLSFLLTQMDKVQAKLDQHKSANEIEAKWEEQDRRIDENAGNIRDLQTWRVSLYQQTGKEQMEMDRSISGIKQLNAERTITMTQAIIGMLIMTLLGLLVYIAQHIR